MNPFSYQNILDKMGFTMWGRNAKVVPEGFNGWHKGLCHLEVVNAIKKRKRLDDHIIFFSAPNAPRETITHSILTDRSGNVVADSYENSGMYIPGEGYQNNGGKPWPVYKILPVKDFVEQTQMKNMTQETAKIDGTVLDNALKELYFIFNYTTSDKKIEGTLQTASKKWEPDFAKFLATYKINKRPFAVLLKAARDNAKFDDAMDEANTEAGKSIYAVRPALDKDISIPAEKLSMIKDFGAAFRKNSQTAIARLERRVSLLKEPGLAALFSIGEKEASTTGEQQEIFNKIKALTKKVTGKAVDKLSMEEAQQLRNKNPEAYKQYLALRRQAKKVADVFIRDLIRKSHKEMLPYDEVINELKKNKMAHGLPAGFEGYIDENLNLRTEAGNHVQGMPSGNIVMNPKYNPEEDNAYVFQAETPNGTQRFYTIEFIQQKRGTEKFEKVKQLREDLSKLRGKWLHDMSSGSLNRRKLFAAECELIYITGARTGNPGNATVDRETGETIPTYGITTLQVKNLIPKQNGFEIKFQGKKLSDSDYMVLPKTPTNRRLIKILEDQIEGKKPDDPVWTYKGKTIPTLAVSKYFKSLGTSASLHKLRHVLGTKIAEKILDESPLKKGKVSQSEAERWYKQALLKVGQELVHTTGHKVTSMTAIKSYIDPGIQQEFFAKLGLRTPKWLQIKAKG
jgi:DNA topoisomerase IB